MTSFEFYREKCKITKYFYCQIVLKDFTLHLIEKDLTKLFSINEDDILYFIAAWQKSNSGSFERISSNSVDTDSPDDEFRFAPYYTYCVNKFQGSYFGLNVLYDLYDKVNKKILEAYIPKLFENYTVQNSSKKFQKEWSDVIKHWEGWKYERSIFLGLSREDKALYKQVDDIIYRFQPEMNWESESSGEYSWFNIVWNTIQIIRNGGGEDEVFVHLSKYALRYEDGQIAYEERWANVLKKLVKLIREG